MKQQQPESCCQHPAIIFLWMFHRLKINKCLHLHIFTTCPLASCPFIHLSHTDIYCRLLIVVFVKACTSGRAGSHERRLAICRLLSICLRKWMATRCRGHHLAAEHPISKQVSEVSVASMFFYRSASQVHPWWIVKITDTYLLKAGGRYFILLKRAAVLFWGGTMCRA